MLGAAVDPPTFEPSAFEHDLQTKPRRRWIGWRLRLLVVAALVGCLALFGLIRMLASLDHVPATWVHAPPDEVVLQASTEPALQPQVGAALTGISSVGRAIVPVSYALLTKSSRWIADDDARAAHERRIAAIDRVFDADRVTLHFADGSGVSLAPRPLGYAGLPVLFWLMSALALLLYLVGAIVLLARPELRNVLFATMALCQATSLLWLGVDAVDALGSAPHLPADGLPWRLGLDLITAAATVHVFALHPKTLAHHTRIGTVAWGVAALITVLALSGGLRNSWWWGESSLLLFGAAALALLSVSYRQEPNPFAAVMRRFGFVALGTKLLVSVAVAMSGWDAAVPYGVAATAAIVWTVFYASLLLLVPYQSRARQVLREFAMLAGLSTIATALYLFFISAFSLGQFTSLTLAVLLALAAYAAARQWVFNQMLGSTLVTTERTFEHLYRVAREVQQHPDRYPELLAQLMRDLFDPIELLSVERAGTTARVAADGAALIVPVIGPGATPTAVARRSIVVRFANRGRHMFTVDDARLTDRVTEQLRRAVAYDEAVERGRTEERLRIAQDLHDDIGARLLTLMYKAQSEEIEDYVRHTLKDLKTLTRGLAAGEHRLSHAAAEWKADIQQRLQAAHVELDWSFRIDHDTTLGVVQWSALTRVLRELISNAIYHAQATRVEVRAQLDRGSFLLSVADDGIGRAPQSWSPGLGLGGVRKRLRLLGGTVQWRENDGHGIVCEVHVPSLAA